MIHVLSVNLCTVTCSNVQVVTLHMLWWDWASRGDGCWWDRASTYVTHGCRRAGPHPYYPMYQGPALVLLWLCSSHCPSIWMSVIFCKIKAGKQMINEFPVSSMFTVICMFTVWQWNDSITQIHHPVTTSNIYLLPTRIFHTALIFLVKYFTVITNIVYIDILWEVWEALKWHCIGACREEPRSLPATLKGPGKDRGTLQMVTAVENLLAASKNHNFHRISHLMWLCGFGSVAMWQMNNSSHTSLTHHTQRRPHASLTTANQNVRNLHG